MVLGEANKQEEVLNAHTFQARNVISAITKIIVRNVTIALIFCSLSTRSYSFPNAIPRSFYFSEIPAFPPVHRPSPFSADQRKQNSLAPPHFNSNYSSLHLEKFMATQIQSISPEANNNNAVKGVYRKLNHFLKVHILLSPMWGS